MAKQEIKREYNCKDEVMLLVLLVIISNARKNLAELTKRNPNWTDKYLDDLEAKVNDAFNNVLGINPKGNQREATESVKEIQLTALSLLSTFKTFLNPVYAEDENKKEAVLYKLGFTTYYKKAFNRKLPELVELLYQFQLNMTSEIKTEITNTENISAEEIDAIISLAESLKTKNVTQKSVQSNSTVITKDGIIILNGLYKSVVPNFSVLVQDFYRKKKSSLVNIFSFNKLKKIVDNPNNGGSDTPPTSSPTIPPENPIIE